MVMERRHLKDSAPREFVRKNLHDDRKGFHDKKSANDRKDDFMLGDNGDAPQPRAQAQRARIAHKDSGRVRIEPEKAQPRANHGAAENGHFACAFDEMDLEIFSKDAVPDKIGDKPQGKSGNHDGNDSQSVQPVCEIDAVGSTRNDKEREDGKEDAQRHGSSF